MHPSQGTPDTDTVELCLDAGSGCYLATLWFIRNFKHDTFPVPGAKIDQTKGAGGRIITLREKANFTFHAVGEHVDGSPGLVTQSATAWLLPDVYLATSGYTLATLTSTSAPTVLSVPMPGTSLSHSSWSGMPRSRWFGKLLHRRR